MRNEEQPAGDAQDVEFVGQVEGLSKVRHECFRPRQVCRHQRQFSNHASLRL
jgi:hypothetical protein